MHKDFIQHLLLLGKTSIHKMPNLFNIPKVSASPHRTGSTLLNIGYLNNIKNGQIGRVGSYNTKSIAELRKGIRETEKYLQSIKDVEHAVAWTPSGEVYHNIGNANEVKIWEVTPKEKLRHAIVTHNHPKHTVDELDHGSISGWDIRDARNNKYALMREVDYRGTSSIHGKGLASDDIHEGFGIEFNRKENQIAAELFQKTGKIAEEQEKFDAINKWYAKKLGYRWWRRPRK